MRIKRLLATNPGLTAEQVITSLSDEDSHKIQKTLKVRSEGERTMFMNTDGKYSVKSK